MTPAPQSEEALLQAAAELAGAERTAFLNGACHGDPALRQRLEVRLAAQDQPDRSTATTDATVEATVKLDLNDGPDEAVGTTLGHYKLLERVGEGGCGVVYVADQTEPVRRRVALKVIKLGMDTKQVVARFEAERQALAMMDHPNIAKVLDAGTTETGRPYFVMELVRGIPITTYCDQSKLSTRDRLDLYIKVCQAIQHAHQKGIIHRDIKPSNILVTLHDGVPVPKVIDFGIAKATEGRLTDATVYTQLHQFIGTPAYMSPEQAEMSGLDIDTRSDIYSLGVLLYELLAGRTPFDAAELVASGIDAMRRTIREKEPVRPSTKLATLQDEELTTTAQRRSVDTSKLANLLRGDLDWIVMKCLEKDRTRRYETANGLASDIKRHLNTEPVVARPPSRLYEFQKTVRRHKFGFIAAAALLAVLAVGVLISTWQAVLATRAKRDAFSARQQSEASEQKAIAAQANETQLRQQAQVAELAARRRAYASDMNVAAQALEANDLGRALDLLNRQRPEPGQDDLRGWEWRYLWEQTRSDASFTLCQEPAEIGSLAVSPDGNWLAVGSIHAGGVALWDLRTRQELVRLAKTESLSCAAFSPTEPLLAISSGTSMLSGLGRNTLRLYNPVSGQMLAEFPQEAHCRGLAFSEDGRTLATFARDDSGIDNGHITLRRMPDGKELLRHPVKPNTGPQALGLCFATTPDLSLAAYVFGKPREVRVGIMDLRTGRELWKTPPAQEYVLSLAFSPDGKTLAEGRGFADSDIRLWDVASGEPIGQLKGHGSWVSSLAFLPGGKQLASSSADQTLRVWDLASMECLQLLRGHRQEVWQLAWLPDGKTLVSGGKDGTVSIWDTSTVQPRRRRIKVAENVFYWGFAADDRSILTLNWQGGVSRWSGSDLQQQETVLDVGPDVFASQFSRDGQYLVTTATNGIIRIWDVSQGVLSRQFSKAPGRLFPMEFIAGNSRLIASSWSDMLFHEWDLRTGLEIQSWPHPSTFRGAWDVTPDEQSILAIGYEGEVVLRHLAAERQTDVNMDILEGVGASYSPDGRHFAVASSLGFARVWDTTTWKPVVTVGGFLHGVHFTTFSPDNRRLVISSDGAEAVRLCETESWGDVFTLSALGTGAGGAFSPDGNNVVWGNSSGTLYLWSAPSWAEIKAAEAKERAAGPQP